MRNFLQKLKNVKWRHYINYILIGLVLIVTSILSLSGNLKLSAQFILEKITIAIMLAVSLGLVVGFLGELSLGHAGFMCIGAYVGGKVAALLAEGKLGNTLPTLLIAIMVGGAVAFLSGLLIGLPALRLKGDYLAIVTLAFGEIVRTLFQNSSEESFGGAIGLETPRFDRKYLFIIGFILILIMLFVIQNLIRSKHGRAITAIRDSEIAARATGINVTKYKLIVFALSAFFAGVAGVIYSYSMNNVSSNYFDYNYSIDILVMVVLGGMGNITGAILSSSAITILQPTLGKIFTGDNAVLQDIIYALILILVVIYNNAPKLKNFREKYNLKNLINKIIRRKKNASYQTDDEAKWDRVPTKIDMDELLSLEVKDVNNEKNVVKDKGGMN